MQKILAIDDKQDNLITLAAVLKNLMPDIAVITAQSGMEGIQKANAESPDVILLDVKMPDMDGFETCRRLKADESTSHIPVIMITAIKTDPHSRIKGLEIGADAFLAKPIDEQELVSQVKVALRIKKAEDALREERNFLEKKVQERTEAMLESLEQYRAATDSSSDYIMRYDKNFRHIFANRIAIEMTGLPVEQYIGKTHREMGFPANLCELWEQHIQIVFDTGKSSRVEFAVEMTQGMLHLDLIFSPEFSSDGSVHSVIGISRDITARRQAEEEKHELQERLSRAEKMESLGLLAGGVAHDLNNVLGIVVGYAELVLDSVDEKSPLRKDLTTIFDGGQKAAAIVEDLLTLARRGVVGKKVLNLNKLIGDFKKSPQWEKLLTYHPLVQIKTDLDPDLLNISASSIHLEKTLYNLVSNACEAMTKHYP